jgi:hypothetical protein
MTPTTQPVGTLTRRCGPGRLGANPDNHDYACLVSHFSWTARLYPHYSANGASRTSGPNAA